MLIHDCVLAAARAFVVSPTEIDGPDRSFRATRPRFAAMYMARLWGFSFPRIGHAMKRDHTTVMNGERRALELAFNDEDYALRLSAAMQEVGLA